MGDEQKFYVQVCFAVVDRW